ncbi:MAG: thiamine pyrophosphate-binding protein [Bacilli bacterium]
MTKENILVSDAIVEFLISRGITDVFGYPGGMVVLLLNSLKKYQSKISFHLSFNEQGAAFEACSWAQVTGKVGVAIATSGPGATNLITGIANAYYDSVPMLLITGQVNTNESSNETNLRQIGFQETPISEIVKKITKSAIYVKNKESLIDNLKKTFLMAISGRKGPVLIDIPMDIQKASIGINEFELKIKKTSFDIDKFTKLNLMLSKAKRPVIILGNGIKKSSNYSINEVRYFFNDSIPVVLTLPAIDLLPTEEKNNFGLIGAYGNRIGNIILSKADLVISIGSRLDVRQVGGERNKFAPNAKIIRIDIDNNEFDYHIHNDDLCINFDAFESIRYINKNLFNKKEWLSTCFKIKKIIEENSDDCLPTNKIVKDISLLIPENSVITTDVGQNQIWVAQSFNFRNNVFLTSSGFGSMGYSLPAAIGAYYGCCGKKKIICFNGDGGIQMNIQELGMIARDQLPIVVIVFNNEALGMIRVFQEIYFKSSYMTTKDSGFSNPNFEKIAEAYNMQYFYKESFTSLDKSLFEISKPVLIEIGIKYPTYINPKLKFKESNDNQIPYLESDVLSKIRKM